jgi:hypothetical protein
VGANDTPYFHRVCEQFRWMARVMVVGVGAIIVIAPLVLPHGYKLEAIVWSLPAICYLFGVWSMGRAMGQVARGRLLEAALPSVLRRVGISLGAGGLMSVFVVGGLKRLVGVEVGGYVQFDVAGMTLGMIGAALFLLGRIVDKALAAQAELDEMI